MLYIKDVKQAYFLNLLKGKDDNGFDSLGLIIRRKAIEVK